MEHRLKISLELVGAYVVHHVLQLVFAQPHILHHLADVNLDRAAAVNLLLHLVQRLGHVYVLESLEHTPPHDIVGDNALVCLDLVDIGLQLFGLLHLVNAEHDGRGHVKGGLEEVEPSLHLAVLRKIGEKIGIQIDEKHAHYRSYGYNHEHRQNYKLMSDNAARHSVEKFFHIYILI